MNPINVNSANVLKFGFTAVFKLFEKVIRFDIANLTTFVEGQESNVQGIFIKVTDPTGIVIKDINLASQDIDPTDPQPFDVTIPSSVFGFGWYTLEVQLMDEDNTLYTIELRKNVCLPEGFKNNGLVDGKMSALVNCYTPSVKISEESLFTYLQKAPVSVVKSGNLYFPQGTVSPVAFTFTPFAVIGAGQVYTGDYLVKNTSTAKYDLDDNVFVEIKYFTSLKFSVVCNSTLNAILCCVTDLKKTYDDAPQSERGIDAKYKLDKAAPSLYLALIKEKVGQDASAEIEQIKTILDCDCKTTTGLLDPISLGTDNNDPQIIQLQQAGGVTIDTDTSGNTTNYTISTKIVQLTKDSGDLNFTIDVEQSQYGIVYMLAFDYSQLAETILTTIGGDDGLTSLLRGILNQNANIDLNGLVANCIISISTCNYTLVEANNTPKTIVSITIDGTVHNAPSTLLLTNTSGIVTWLNGLSLGTFTANLNSGTVAITSNANTHNIQTLIFSIGSVQTTRQFNKNCLALVDVLNAITTYVCTIDGTKVKFGATGLQIYTINSDGVTINKANVSLNSSVSGVLVSLISAQNALVTSLAGAGLNCTNIKSLFIARDLTLLSTDVILGTKNGQCASMTNDEYASILLNKIMNSTSLASQLCGIVQSCSGAVCAPVTNVSGVFASGTLTVNANGVLAPTTPIRILYRVNNSGLTFTTVTGVGSDLPKAIGAGALAAAQYEVQVQQQCTNGVWSPVVAAVTNNTCVMPQAFTVNQSGTNFVVAATLTNPQTKLELTMTDPNGGVTVTIHDFGAGVYAGTYNVAIPTGIYGTYTFKARAVCDSTTTPIFASNFTSNVQLNIVNPTANNINVVPNYNLGFTDISNGTASGVPVAFNGATINSATSAYSGALSNGTISFTVALISGSFPAIPVYARLYKNGTTLVAQTLITAVGTYTLNNTGTITAPDTANINIES